MSMTPEDIRLIEKNFHVTKLKLLEVFPLFPFLMDRRNLTCIEIGANKGVWLEAFFEVFGDRVEAYHAFEPVPPTYSELTSRIETKLGYAKSKIFPHDMCAGDSNGFIDIHYTEKNSTLASILITETLVGKNVIPNDLKASVKQIRLDDFMAQKSIESVDIIKIDVEGYEWQVLQGLISAIESGAAPMIYFEFGSHQKQVGQNFEMFFDFFHDHGYKLFRQRVGRNFFGTTPAQRNDPELVSCESMWMLLATRVGVSPNYRGPNVGGR